MFHFKPYVPNRLVHTTPFCTLLDVPYVYLTPGIQCIDNSDQVETWDFEREDIL